VFAPHAEYHFLRGRDAGVLLSRPQAVPAPLNSVPLARKDELLQRHRRCVYNFCRRLSACPAGTQCQSEQTMNVFASSRELARHAQQSDPLLSRYDIKQKTKTKPSVPAS
jgi:hypothetical protein